jgi:hypothetical protein
MLLPGKGWPSYPVPIGTELEPGLKALSILEWRDIFDFPGWGFKDGVSPLVR